MCLEEVALSECVALHGWCLRTMNLQKPLSVVYVNNLNVFEGDCWLPCDLGR